MTKWQARALDIAYAPLFERWLEEHFPNRKERVLGRIRHLRGGERLNDPRFKSRRRDEGVFAGQIRSLFEAGWQHRDGPAGEAIDHRFSSAD